jgi:hypothetical protein
MIKSHQIEPVKSDAFQNCILKRKKYADVLTNVIKTYSDGFVLAINNKWGTGKTTFIRMWEQDLKDNEFKTIYFNAWENDFDDNPLTALLGELKSLSGNENDNFNKVLKNAAIISKNIAPIIFKSLSRKYLGIDSEDIAEGITNATTDIFENEVNEYSNKKEGIKEFKANLQSYITETWNGKPIVFFIDELDRCRPDYAVTVLEQIKHFFNIPNIVFVLSIDKEQLSYAIHGVYGSDKIDSNEYLRRFIDLEYSIPKPEIELFFNYLYKYYSLDDFLNNQDRLRSHEFHNDKSDFQRFSILLFELMDLSLRQIEKIFSSANLCFKSMSYNHYLLPEIFIYLIVLKIIDKETFNKIKDKKITLIELQNYFFDSIKLKLEISTKQERRNFIRCESYLVFMYNEYISNYENKTELIRYNLNDNSNPFEIKIKSLTDNSEGQNLFGYNLNHFDKTYHRGNLIIESFFSKMELLEGFKN